MDLLVLVMVGVSGRHNNNITRPLVRDIERCIRVEPRRREKLSTEGKMEKEWIVNEIMAR